MKKTLLLMSVGLLIVASARAQGPIKVYTSPKLPTREPLDRMNLQIAWHARVTVDGNRDGVASVQLLPGKTNQLIVQTYKGGVFLYDADQGDLIWKTHVGVPYWTPQPAAYNSHSIFVTRRKTLHVLSRVDGVQRVYTYDARLKVAEFGYELLNTPNAGPVADEDFLYVSMGDRLQAIFLPDFGAMDRGKAKTAAQKKNGKDAPLLEEAGLSGNLDSAQPEFSWGYRFGDQFSKSTPMIYGDQVSALMTDGALISIGRFGKVMGIDLNEFKAIGKSPGTPAQHQNMAYFGSDDFNLYAINMDSGRLVWRYVAGAPVMVGPNANDRDVFVYPERIGLRRIDRASGREMWTNRDTQKFLAANDAYVYALDRHGRFYVVDSRRGTTLATHDLSDWAIPVPNEWTDRIYLAANDGQVLCLRRKDLVKPMIMKTLELPRVPEKKEPMEEKKEAEEKKDEKGMAPRRDFDVPWQAVVRKAEHREAPNGLVDRRAWMGP